VSSVRAEAIDTDRARGVDAAKGRWKMRNTETFVIATTAGACMLALGVALGGGVIPAQLLLLGFGLVGICATFAYATISIIQDAQGSAPKKTIVEYRQAWEAPDPRRYVYRIEAPDQEEIIEAYPEYLPDHRGPGGPSWIVRR